MGCPKSSAKLQETRSPFADAVTALEDEQALTLREHTSREEERWIALGTDAYGSLLVVVYTWRGENVRLISARQATRRERSKSGEEYEK